MGGMHRLCGGLDLVGLPGHIVYKRAMAITGVGNRPDTELWHAKKELAAQSPGPGFEDGSCAYSHESLPEDQRTVRESPRT